MLVKHFHSTFRNKIKTDFSFDLMMAKVQIQCMFNSNCIVIVPTVNEMFNSGTTKVNLLVGLEGRRSPKSLWDSPSGNHKCTEFYGNQFNSKIFQSEPKWRTNQLTTSSSLANFLSLQKATTSGKLWISNLKILFLFCDHSSNQSRPVY